MKKLCKHCAELLKSIPPKKIEKDFDGYPEIKSLENVGYNKALKDLLENHD